MILPLRLTPSNTTIKRLILIVIKTERAETGA